VRWRSSVAGVSTQEPADRQQADTSSLTLLPAPRAATAHTAPQSAGTLVGDNVSLRVNGRRDEADLTGR